VFFKLLLIRNEKHMNFHLVFTLILHPPLVIPILLTYLPKFFRPPFHLLVTIRLHPIHTFSLTPTVFSCHLLVRTTFFKTFKQSSCLSLRALILYRTVALRKPLSKLFQLSLLHSYFPEVWKKSCIIPLLKTTVVLQK